MRLSKQRCHCFMMSVLNEPSSWASHYQGFNKLFMVSSKQPVRFEDSPAIEMQLILLGGTTKASHPNAQGGAQCPPSHQGEGRLGVMSANHFAVVIIRKSPSSFLCDVDINPVSPRAVYR